MLTSLDEVKKNVFNNCNEDAFKSMTNPLKTVSASNNKCWPVYGIKGTLAHCWWERKLVQPLWKTI